MTLLKRRLLRLGALLMYSVTCITAALSIDEWNWPREVGLVGLVVGVVLVIFLTSGALAGFLILPLSVATFADWACPVPPADRRHKVPE